MCVAASLIICEPNMHIEFSITVSHDVTFLMMVAFATYAVYKFHVVEEGNESKRSLHYRVMDLLESINENVYSTVYSYVNPDRDEDADTNSYDTATSNATTIASVMAQTTGRNSTNAANPNNSANPTNPVGLNNADRANNDDVDRVSETDDEEVD